MARRTEKGNVTAETRERFGMKDEEGKQTGRFPVFDRQSALSALKLRGHAKSRKERMRIIRRAMRFAKEEAQKAMEEDREAGVI